MTDPVPLLEAAVVGRTCRLERRAADWVFHLGEAVSLAVGCHWRIVSAEGIVLTDGDDGHRFGLPAPVDAEARANASFAGATVASAAVDRVTADFQLRLSNGLHLDLLNNSSGYEGWEGRFRLAGEAVALIAMGGGGLVLHPAAAAGEPAPGTALTSEPTPRITPAQLWSFALVATLLFGYVLWRWVT
ncbi:MAG TPA: hypothetical protein VGN74_07925 [Brevundimonas sp.]|jgi:hypothetical protein|uniref:hypothetical protein n=1 Tax=Brevundimonas sp. TaxID=1871086 RepID=UPI002E155BB1|nr:hypothetical protein [Brevundimonas sp.]